jgi:hypothetical protein
VETVDGTVSRLFRRIAARHAFPRYPEILAEVARAS